MAVSGDWYARQFGDTEHFALRLVFGRDPHPIGDPARDAGWGGFALWVRGRCLTRSLSDGAVSDHVTWNLIDVLSWLRKAGPRLVNEEAFPLAPKQDRLGDACDWLDATEDPFPTLTEAEERAWFLRRSDWRTHHALRAAALDVALPNVLIRRLGDFVEVSWDNESWGPPRRDLTFVERRGRELVSARQFAATVSEALADAARVLKARAPDLDLRGFETGLVEASSDWTWLVPVETGRAMAKIASLANELARHTALRREGWFVPHSPETLALRQTHLGSPLAIEAFLTAIEPPSEPLSQALRALIRPEPAPPVRPWAQGYAQAEQVRSAFQLGDEPLPDLTSWLRSHHVAIGTPRLDPSIAIVATRSSTLGGKCLLNPDARSRLRREIGHAAALGHLLFDPSDAAVEGTWEYWPAAARARAFGAALLLPIAGVRDALGREHIDAEAVHRVMQRFHVGPFATTYHLANHGFIDEERRTDLLRELAA
jgi:hypothetical protein